VSFVEARGGTAQQAGLDVDGFDEVGVHAWVEPVGDVGAQLVAAVAQYLAE